METRLILTEKSSAMQAFSRALGGHQGTFDNFNYVLVHAHGHLMELANPDEQVDDPDIKAHLAKWSDVQSIPWPLDQFKWKLVPKKGARDTLNQIKRAGRDCDSLIIATDDDPSGEGDVLGQEIVDAIGWNKPVYRMRFADQEPASIKKALRNLEDMRDPWKVPAYRRGIARQRFDYATMQYSRLATHDLQLQGLDGTITPGRLKSAIVDKTYQQIKGRDNFTPEDQYQAIFVDENGTKFFNSKLPKYKERVKAELDMHKLRQSPVVTEKPVRKHQHAPKMMNFTTLGIAVHSRGFSLAQFINTYQKMYEAGFLSYPRTEDTAMTEEQWKSLEPLADDIAGLIGCPPDKLTHRDPRSPYVTNHKIAHGCNRPGLTVPKSLDDLESQFGKIGKTIYTVAAMSYLATMADDYEYDQTKAHIQDFPAFTATKNVKARMGYKFILGSVEQAIGSGKKKSNNDDGKPFGHTGTPNINVTKTKAPSKPSEKFILSYLIKESIGTEATRSQTLVAMTSKKSSRDPALKAGKSQLNLTPTGFATGGMMHGTLIASPNVTRQLSQMMGYIADGKWNYGKLYQTTATVINADRKTMEQNAGKLKADPYLKDKLPKPSVNRAMKKEGTFKPTGETVKFNVVYRGYHFTEDEQNALLNGETVTITIPDKYHKGGHTKVSGKLAHQSFKNKKGETIKYWGYKAEKYTRVNK